MMMDDEDSNIGLSLAQRYVAISGVVCVTVSLVSYFWLIIIRWTIMLLWRTNWVSCLYITRSVLNWVYLKKKMIIYLIIGAYIWSKYCFFILLRLKKIYEGQIYPNYCKANWRITHWINKHILLVNSLSVSLHQDRQSGQDFRPGQAQASSCSQKAPCQEGLGQPSQAKESQEAKGEEAQWVAQKGRQKGTFLSIRCPQRGHKFITTI